MIQNQAESQVNGLAKLAQVTEIGMARAGQGLSEMVGVPIEVVAPRVRIEPLSSVPNLVGAAEELVVGIYLSMMRDVSGHIILMFPYSSATALVDALLDQPVGSTETLDRMAESALAEVANLTGSFFLNALSDGTGFSIQPSPPAVATDMAVAVLDAVLADLSQYGEDGLMIDTSFRQEDRAINGYFLVFPDRASFEAIMTWVGP